MADGLTTFDPIPKLGVFILGAFTAVPQMATQGSACFDLSAYFFHAQSVTIYAENNVKTERDWTTIAGVRQIFVGPKERAMIPTGLVLDIPKGYSVRIHSRSSLALKRGLIMANQEGVIDSDYVDPVMVLLYNNSSIGATIYEGDRIAQAELIKSVKYDIIPIDEKPSQKTDRTGGFGSTGSNSY